MLDARLGDLLCSELHRLGDLVRCLGSRLSAFLSSDPSSDLCSSSDADLDDHAEENDDLLLDLSLLSERPAPV